MSDRIPDIMMNRRQLIAGLGCAYALGTSVSSAQEAQPMDRRDVQRILSEQYGERAAKAGSEIILSEWGHKRKERKIISAVSSGGGEQTPLKPQY